MKKVLVTGGKGLVGSALTADVKIGREYDLTRNNEVETMFHTHNPTHVIHCAGKVGGAGDAVGAGDTGGGRGGVGGVGGGFMS